MGRLCRWQCGLLTLPRARYLGLLTVHWVVQAMLLVLSLALVAEAVCEGAAVWAFVEAFAPACRVGRAPQLLGALGALGACAAVWGLAHGAAVHDYQASLCRRRSMCAQLVLSLQLVVLAVAAALSAAVLITRVLDELPDGLLAAMRCYNRSGAAKAKLDHIQFELQCCGATSYREWFNITWFDVSLGGPELFKGRTVCDDVPYSCCRRDVLMPCIHHEVLSPNPVYKYDPPQDMTISTDGCATVLSTRVKRSTWQVADILCAFAILQGLGAVLARLVQTAVQSAQDVHPLPATASALRGRARRRALEGVVVHAWLLGCKPEQPPPQQLPPLPTKRSQGGGDDSDSDSDSLPEFGDSPADEERSLVEYSDEEEEGDEEPAPVAT